MDDWETKQSKYVYTVEALRRYDAAINAAHRSPNGSNVRVVLLCGADMLASFLIPGVWSEAHMREILDKYGVVCVYREGTDLEKLIETEVRASSRGCWAVDAN